MSSRFRELADNGAFEAKPTDRRWRFWPRRCSLPVPYVVVGAAQWILARERAVLELARKGVLVAAQDLDSEPVMSDLNGAVHS